MRFFRDVAQMTVHSAARRRMRHYFARANAPDVVCIVHSEAAPYLSGVRFRIRGLLREPSLFQAGGP